MKIKILSDITSWKNYRNLKSGTVYDMPPEDAQKLVQGGQAAEVIEEFLGEGDRKRIEAEVRKPSLADFLQGKEEKHREAPPKPEEKKKAEIDPELAGWLSSKGFTLGPEGIAFVRTDRLETGDVVKLQVDFSDTPKGARYGYRLDIEKDPPEWKSDPHLHDHPLLLQFKRFRDDLLTQHEHAKTTPPKAKPIEAPAKGGASLALMPPEVEEAKEMEHRDEAFIMREIKGDIKVLERALADYFYSFELRGRKVIGLSYAGVKAIIRRMGRIEILEIKVEEKEKSWFVLVKARDKLKDLEAYGAAAQPKRFMGGGENPFALTVAVSKAQRNAWRHFIDEKIVTEAYRAWLEERSKEQGERK